MPYKPNEFSDIPGDAKMAPSELRPPLNFADGGAVNWASDATIYNTQSQLGNLAATPGGFGGMAKQFTTEAPFGGNTSMPPLPMAKGGSVSNLIGRLKEEFSKRGLDFDRAMAQRLAQKGQNGDTMLAHINPQEAQMLKQAGGSGKINPNTGLPSFGVDDGPESGSTGSATGNSYGGGDGPSGGSDEGMAARAGDTPGFGSGGGDSVGGGGGYGITSGGDLAGGGDFGGGGGRDSGSSSMLDTVGNVINRIIGVTPAEAGTASSQGWANYYAKGITPQPEINYGTGQPSTVAPSGSQTLFTGTPTPTTNPFEGMFVSATGGVYPGAPPSLATNTFQGENITPAGPFTDQQMSMPAVRSPEQMAAVQSPTDTFYSRLAENQAMRDTIRAMDQQQQARDMQAAAASAGPNEAYGGTSQEFESQSPFGAYTQATTTPRPFDAIMSSIVAKGVQEDQASKAPTESPYGYTPPVTSSPLDSMSMDAKLALLDAARKAAPVSSTDSNIPFPTPVPGRVQAQPSVTAEAPAITAPVTLATATQNQIPLTLNSSIFTPNANRQQIAKLEAEGKTELFPGGIQPTDAEGNPITAKEWYLQDMQRQFPERNYTIDDVKSGLLTRDGQQVVGYAMKDPEVALMEGLIAPFKALGDLFSPSVENLPRGSSVRDPRFADLFTQNVPSTGFGPYGDLTREEYQKQYGGRDYGPQISGPSGGRASASNLSKFKYPFAGRSGETPVEPPPAPLADYRTRIGLPIDPYNYGYGGEYTYYSAKGGAVSPLKKVRK